MSYITSRRNQMVSLPYCYSASYFHDGWDVAFQMMSVTCRDHGIGIGWGRTFDVRFSILLKLINKSEWEPETKKYIKKTLKKWY